nr:PREDICTED: interleukin-1 receptor type 1-like [Paralichthys olivaceus]
MSFGLSVSAGGCPDPSENISTLRGVNGGFPCKQIEIFRLNNTRSIQWMKDCHPVEPSSLDEDGYMRLLPASEEDAGKYTCLVDVSFNGRSYTAARSIQLSIKKDLSDAIIAEPKLLFPHQEVVVVEVGMRAELQCLAYIGFSEDPKTLMYWTVGDIFPEDYREVLNESFKNIHERGKVYRLSTLSISKVDPRFLNVPICCHITNAAGMKVRLILLQEAPDGKLYDGYVSFLRPSTLSSSEMANFALQILPEELEKKHGYSLYIRGRDDCPGEASHDTIAATLHQCRRLIIILSPDAKSPDDSKTEEMSPLCDEQNQLCYEQKIGIYDALTQNEARVILVEIGGPVDYSRLPESLHYIKRKQGALKWKNASNGTHSLSKLHSNRRFWKNLRYHMPSVPAGEHQTMN